MDFVAASEESFFPVVLDGLLHDVSPLGWRNGSSKHIMDLRETILSSDLHTVYVPRARAGVFQGKLAISDLGEYMYCPCLW